MDASAWAGFRDRVRDHVFRAWTAAAVLAGYGYAWVYRPEILTWWKRLTARAIERGCDLLPYPWGDRIEATLGNIGLWVQVTLAIIAFRVLVSVLAAIARRIWRGRSVRPRRRQARAGERRPPRPPDG